MMVVVFVVAIVPHEVYGQSGDSRCCSGGCDFLEFIGCHCGWSSNAHLGQGSISMKFDTLMLYSECSDL